MSEESGSQREEDYQRGLGYLQAYKEKHGDCGVPQSFKTEDGFRLGSWCASRRNEYAKSRLSQGRIDALEELRFIWGSEWARSSNALRNMRGREFDEVDLPRIVRSAAADGLELSDRDLWLVTSRIRRIEGMCPPTVSDFVARLLAESSAQTVLDPCVGLGSLLRTVLREINAAVFVGIQKDAVMLKVTEERLADHRGDVRVADLKVALKKDEVFDLVVSCPPFGGADDDFTVEDMDFRDGIAGKLLLRSVLRMSPSGVGCFVVTPSFLQSRRKKAVGPALSHFGVYIDASFSFPAGTFSPHTNVESCVIVVRRGEAPEAMFVAEVPDSAKAQDAVIAHYRERSSGSEPELGVWVDRRSFKSLKHLVSTKNLEKRTKRLDLPKRALHELCTAAIVRCPKERDGIPDVANSFFFCLVRPSLCRFDPTSLPKHPSNWVHVQVDPELADARVVARFLDSPLGRLVIEPHVAYAAAVPRMQVSSVGDLSVWLPDLKRQRSIIVTEQRLMSLSEAIDDLRTRLWSRLDRADEVEEALERVNRDDAFPLWLDTLPFPLASILWIYHTVQKESQKAFQQLDFFFEGLSQFLAILALSALMQDSVRFHNNWPLIREKLDQNKQSLDRPTIGVWVSVFEYLAKMIRSDMNDSDKSLLWQRLFACEDLDLLKAIVSKEMVVLLRRTCSLRNGWRGHGGLVSDNEARIRESTYKDLLLDFRKLVGGRWENYPLIMPKSGRYSGGQHHYSVDRLVGTRTPFDSFDLSVQKPMEDGQLHMVALHARTSCPVLPFVKIGPSPEHALNACYFYNRVETEGLKYVSYHFGQQSEIVEKFSGTKTVLAELASVGSLEVLSE